MRIHVELQEGWTGERVEIRVQGSRRYAGHPVTRQQIGYADRLVVDVAEDVVSMDVRVPERSIALTRSFHVADEHWIGLSLADRRLAVVEQPTPFGYV